MKKRLILLVGLLLFASSAFATGDINTADCELSTVQADVITCQADSTCHKVTVHSGSCSWTAALRVGQDPMTFAIIDIDKDFTLMADGACTGCGTSSASWSGNTHINCDTASGGNACIVIVHKYDGANPSAIIRLSGLDLEWVSGESMILNSAWNSRVDNMKLYVAGTAYATNPPSGDGANHVYHSGVYDHNYMFNIKGNTYGDRSGTIDEWTLDSVIGDGVQEYVHYFEYNSFFYTAPQPINVIDMENASRVVFRYNYVENAYFEAHGIHCQDSPYCGTTPPRNARSWEIYRNQFYAEASYGINATMFLRSGTGMVFENEITGFWNQPRVLLDNQRANNDWGGSMSNGRCMGESFFDGNTTQGWPCLDQPGRGTSAAYGTFQPQALEPAYFWKDTYNGSSVVPQVSGSNAIKTCSDGGSGTWGAQCDILPNRDVYYYDAGFDGTSGVGYGTRASRPSTCTTGVAWFSTDQGTWNANGADGVLDKCTSTDSWSDGAYIPFTNPHPLAGGGSTDTTDPTVGGSGVLSTGSITSSSITVSWTKGTDDTSAAADLTYNVCRSSSNNMTTDTDALTNGTCAGWQTDVDSRAISGLSSSTLYYFNVVIRDEAGNTAPYTTTSATTSSGGGGGGAPVGTRLMVR